MKMIWILFVSIEGSCSVPWIPCGSPGCSGAEWNTCEGQLFKYFSRLIHRFCCIKGFKKYLFV